MKILENLAQKPALPIHADLSNPPPTRLKSRSPIWATEFDHSHPEDKWRTLWENCDLKNKHLIQDPTKRPYGMKLKHKVWSSLNRFRSGHGCCGELEFKWGRRNNPLCACGEIQSMNHIVECGLNKCPWWAAGIA